MVKTYKIVDATINHETAGIIVKQNIEYFINGKFEFKEFYSKEGIVYTDIRTEYKLDISTFKTNEK